MAKAIEHQEAVEINYLQLPTRLVLVETTGTAVLSFAYCRRRLEPDVLWPFAPSC